MFYIKEPLTDCVDVTVEINDDNVFCRCPVCGREVKADLQNILSEAEVDLMGTAVMCDECAEEWMKEHGKRSDT